MFPVLITRPEPGATQTAKMFEEARFRALVEPLLEIIPKTQLSIDFKKYQAIVTTSAMAIRTLAQSFKERDFSLWCVGKSSSEIARQLGYKKIYCSEEVEDAYNLFLSLQKELNPKEGPIFYAAGDHIRIDLKKLLIEAKFKVDKEIIYQSKMKQEISLKTKMFLEQNTQGAITFYSKRTFEAFLFICQKKRIPFAFNRFIALSLSDAISREVEKLPWLQVITASTTAQLIANLKKIVG